MNDQHHSFSAAPPLADPRVQLRKEFAMPLIVIGLLVSLALTMCVHFGVRALNQESAAREQQLVRNGLALRAEEVASLIVPQTNWDDAVLNLDNAYDPVWTNANVNEFLSQVSGFDAEFVLDSNDRPIFAAVDGKVRAVGEFLRFAQYGDDLVRSVRKQESLRGPLRKIAGPGMISRPIQASSFKVIDGQLTILTATLVQPDFGTALSTGPRAPVVLTGMHVDKSFLAQFSKRFLLDKVHTRFPAQPVQAGSIEIPVTDESGKLQAHLAWTPLDPGYGMLRRMAVPVMLGLLLLAAIAAIELRRVFRAARDLIERERIARIWALEIDGASWPIE